VAPNWYKPHLLLAQILQAENRNDEAGREARISADLGGARNNFLRTLPEFSPCSIIKPSGTSD